MPGGLCVGDLYPLRTDHQRRITETLTAGQWEFGEQINGFQAMVFCIRALEGHLSQSPTKSLPKCPVRKTFSLLTLCKEV